MPLIWTGYVYFDYGVYIACLLTVQGKYEVGFEETPEIFYPAASIFIFSFLSCYNGIAEVQKNIVASSLFLNLD